MSIEIEVKRPSTGFTMVPNDLLRDDRLSMEARGFLAFLLSFEDGWTHQRPYLEKVCGFGKDKFNRVSRELRSAGYLNVVPVSGPGGKMMGRRWVIDFDRKPENPTFGDRKSEKPNFGSADVGQPDYKRRTDLKENQILKEDQPQFFDSDDSKPKKRTKRKNTDQDLVTILATVVKEDSARDFIDHRKALKRPMTEGAAKRMASRLAKMRDPDEAIDTAIRRGWLDVYEKEDQSQAQVDSQIFTDEQGRQYRQEQRVDDQRMYEFNWSRMGPEDREDYLNDFDVYLSGRRYTGQVRLQ